jgi:hypothetical protein|tara:strand:- start:37 stop:261 length:225 start_codon:yes stop_codon:yes gene_type:complete
MKEEIVTSGSGVKIIDDDFFETPKTQDELYELVKKEAGKNTEMIWPMWKAVMWTQNLINHHNLEIARYKKGEEA